MTENQKKILQMLAQGAKSMEIARKMGISQRTVEKHLEILRAAYGAKNAPNLIHLAHRNKLIE